MKILTCLKAITVTIIVFIESIARCNLLIFCLGFLYLWLWKRLLNNFVFVISLCVWLDRVSFLLFFSVEEYVWAWCYFEARLAIFSNEDFPCAWGLFSEKVFNHKAHFLKTIFDIFLTFCLLCYSFFLFQVYLHLITCQIYWHILSLTWWSFLMFIKFVDLYSHFWIIKKGFSVFPTSEFFNLI